MEKIKIGNQVWMSKNLDVSRFCNGDLIPEIKTWPMPATSYLFIDAGTIQPVKIEIVDRLGKIVFNSLWKNKVDVSNLASGYYFLRVYSRTGVKTKQVEVIR